MRRLPPALAITLATTLAGAAAPWPTATRWRLNVESTLDADRWRGLAPRAQDRFDVRQRLQLDLYVLRPDARGRGPSLTLATDLVVASDLGPDGPELAIQPDGRRAALDLYRAAAELRTARIDVTAGRQIWSDALGFDALDGVRVDARALPYVTLHAGAGLAVRRGVTDFGPDLFSLDGTRLPTTQARIWTAGVSLRDVRQVALRADWRRTADEVVQRDQIAVASRLQPVDGVWLDGGGRADLVFGQLADLWADLGGRPTAQTTLSGGWRRARPVFSADSIWNAFGPTAWHEGHLRGRWADGTWQVAADGAVRWFDLGSRAAQTPADPGGGVAATPEDDQPGLDAGAQLTRRFTLDGTPGHAGLQARLGTGYGGDRHLVDLFSRVPIPLIPGNHPLALRSRLGLLWVNDDDRPTRSGPSGWAVLGLDWRANEVVRLQALAEGHLSEHTPGRLRLMTRATFLEWW